MVSQSLDVDVAVVFTVVPVEVARNVVVVEQREAVSVRQLVGSSEYVSWPSSPMVIGGHGGSVPESVKPGGHSIPGGGPGG
jgi:hypothetical protein